MKRCERSARPPVGCSALESFGPDVKYVSVSAGMKQNRPPTESMQYFGLAKIDGTNRAPDDDAPRSNRQGALQHRLAARVGAVASMARRRYRSTATERVAGGRHERSKGGARRVWSHPVPQAVARGVVAPNFHDGSDARHFCRAARGRCGAAEDSAADRFPFDGLPSSRAHIRFRCIPRRSPRTRLD